MGDYVCSEYTIGDDAEHNNPNPNPSHYTFTALDKITYIQRPFQELSAIAFG